MPRITILIVLMAVAAFLVAGLSAATVSAASGGSADLTLGVKPCPPEDNPNSIAACTTAKVLVKKNVTVSVEMKQFNIPATEGYDAWEAAYCFPHKNLEVTGVTFKGGPVANRLAPNAQAAMPGLQLNGLGQATGLTDLSATHACRLVGASVGPGEDGSKDLQNLANIEFQCIQDKKASTIEVLILSASVIMGNGKTDNQGGNALLGGVITTGTKPNLVLDGPKVTIDCRTAEMSVTAEGGFFRELTAPVTATDKKSEKNVSIHVKAEDKIKVTVSIDTMNALSDKDNPGDGGGYTSVESILVFDDTELDVATGNDGLSVAAALVPCTVGGFTANPQAEVALFKGATDEIKLTCASNKAGGASDENQGTGAVFTVTFQCQDANDSTSTITLKDSSVIESENNQALSVFDNGTITVICIGDTNDKDQDGCDHGAEAKINKLSQELAGIDFMDPNIYDFPDVDSDTSTVPVPVGTPLSLKITINDVLAYVQDFGKNDPNVPPATKIGSTSVDEFGNNDPATVHDVSQPNNGQIGTDDVLRAALLFGIKCQITT